VLHSGNKIIYQREFGVIGHEETETSEDLTERWSDNGTGINHWT
jgi:hypothetical protein